MISAEFRKHDNQYCSFALTGHAGFADYGQDIVCAGVTSAVQLTANGITEVLGIPAKVRVSQNEITLALPQACDPAAYAFLEALRLQLSVLEEDYSDHIKVTITEV